MVVIREKVAIAKLHCEPTADLPNDCSTTAIEFTSVDEANEPHLPCEISITYW